MTIRHALCLAACIAVLAACSERKPVKIGFVAGLTGRHYNLGISGRNGAMLAIEDANAKGGRPVELVTRDDKQETAAAVKAVEELLGEGVVAIVGHMTSAMSEATLPLINKNKMLTVSPTTSSAFFAGKDDHFVMMHPSTRIAAGRMAVFIRNNLRLGKVSIIYDLSNRQYTQSWHDSLKEELEKRGGRVTGSVAFSSGSETRFLPLAASALSRDPEGIVVIANALDSALICQQIRKLNKKVAILGSEWALTSDFLKNGGSAIEGMYFIQKVNLDDRSPRFKAFRETYTKRFGVPPDFAAILAYDSVNVVLEALGDGTTGAALKEALIAKRAFTGLQGVFEIDANGDAQRRHYIVTVSGNTYKTVE